MANDVLLIMFYAGIMCSCACCADSPQLYLNRMQYISLWCVYATWWRHQMETLSALLALCAGNSPVTGEFSPQRPVTRSFDAFFDLGLNKRLTNNRFAGDLRRHRAHYDVTVISGTRKDSNHLSMDLRWCVGQQIGKGSAEIWNRGLFDPIPPLSIWL